MLVMILDRGFGTLSGPARARALPERLSKSIEQNMGSESNGVI